MTFNTVGIFSIGEMGQSVAQVLRTNGLRTITSLSGRSEGTKRRAEEAGVKDRESVAQVVSEADIILSITHSSSALQVGKEVAVAIRETGKETLFADLNSIGGLASRDPHIGR